MIFLFWIKSCLNGICPSIQEISKPCIQGLHCLNSPQSFTCNTFKNLDSNSFIKKEKDKFCIPQENNYPIEVNEKLTTEESDKIRNNLMYRGYQIYSNPQIKYCKPLRFEDFVIKATKKEKLELKENPAIKNSESIHYNVENIRNPDKESVKKNQEKYSVQEDISSKKASKADVVKQNKPESTNESDQVFFFYENEAQKKQHLFKNLYHIDTKFKCLDDSSIYKIKIKQMFKNQYLPEKINIDLKMEKNPVNSGKLYQLKATIKDNQGRYPKNFFSAGEIQNDKHSEDPLIKATLSTLNYINHIIENKKNQEVTAYGINNKISKLFRLEKNIRTFSISSKSIAIFKILEDSTLELVYSDEYDNYYEPLHFDADVLKYCDKQELDDFLLLQSKLKKSFVEFFSFFSREHSSLNKNKSDKDLENIYIRLTKFYKTNTHITEIIGPDRLLILLI